MKKIFTIAIMLMAVLTASAQTDFRHFSFDEAVKAAETENKLVFIDFYTSWCGPCKMMASQTFPQKKVGTYMNERFVSIKIDAEKGEGVALAKHYGIKGYPTMLIVDKDKNEVTRTVGFRDAESFIGELQRLLDPTMTPERMKQRYEAGERNAELVRNYAGYLIDSLQASRPSQDVYDRKSADIRAMVTGYFAQLSEEDKLKSENMFVFTTYTGSVSEPAARFLIDNRAKYKGDEKAQVDSIIRSWYERDVQMILAGMKKYDATEVATLKKDINALGLNADKHHDTTFTFIEEAQDDIDQPMKFLAFCKDNFKSLAPDHQTALLTGFTRRFANCQKEERRLAARFLRDNLSELEFGAMYFSVMGIKELESDK